MHMWAYMMYVCSYVVISILYHHHRGFNMVSSFPLTPSPYPHAVYTSSIHSRRYSEALAYSLRAQQPGNQKSKRQWPQLSETNRLLSNLNPAFFRTLMCVCPCIRANKTPWFPLALEPSSRDRPGTSAENAPAGTCREWTAHLLSLAACSSISRDS